MQGAIHMKAAEEEAREFVTRLCRAHGRELQGFLERLLGARAPAEEIAQETYLKLYRLSRPGEVNCPRALLFDAATKLAFSYRRRLRSEGRVMAADVDGNLAGIEAEDERPQPDRVAALEQGLQWLAQIVEQLPLQLRQVFTMRHVEQLSRQEIADRLNISVKTVEKRLGRAVAHSRQRLSALGLQWLGLD